jgi:hypothetical protein
MSFWDDVTPQSVANAPDGFKEFQIGENEAFIQSVNESTSKNSGKKMLDIVFKKMDGAEIHYYIVDDEFKMQKLKAICICFGIPIGSTNIEEWRGKRGIVVCKQGEPYDGKIYNKVSYLKPMPANGSAKPSNSPNYRMESNSSAKDGFIDDIPF